MHYVYVLKCKDEKTYSGCTNNLRDSFIRHNKGFIEATRRRLPVSLICYFAFDNKEKAFQFEKYLKTASRRAFMRKRLL